MNIENYKFKVIETAKKHEPWVWQKKNKFGIISCPKSAVFFGAFKYYVRGRGGARPECL